jgi:putative flippase GtrA
MNKAQILQISRFLTVGTLAAAVHFGMVVWLVQSYDYLPLIANVAGFVVSFQISYWGHRLWTFSGTGVSHREAYPRLVLIQVLNFGMNESLYYFFLGFGLPYQWALLIVLAILPIFTFISSKFWVFQN